MNTMGLYLSSLSLKNFATFEDQAINFDTGFNAIVGETGSGKSLILDALQLILGHRADKRTVRNTFEFAIVEGVFTCTDIEIKNYFDQNNFPYDQDEIHIKRIIYKNGKSKAFLNHQSCQLATLTKFAKRYIDLVGQFENQKLLSSNYQLLLLDQFSVNETLKSEYSNVFNHLIQNTEELKSIENKKLEITQKLDYLTFQISEFEKLNPSSEREIELVEKKRSLQNLEENKISVDKLNQLFDGGDHNLPGLLDLLNQVEREITDKLLDKESIEQFFNAKEALNDINYKINSSVDFDYSDEDLEAVLDELDLYQKLKRKYQASTDELINIYHGFIQERKELENLTDSVDILKDKIKDLRNTCINLSDKLHERRVKYSQNLSEALTKEVQNLKMSGATVKIEVTKLDELNSNGQSSISFLAETNPGEGFFKIKDIASGGELSRILLALRTLLSSKDSINIFLFDEIDTGIGGETAITVGNSLNKVSNNSQVIAITHLPQIAKFADKLIKVSKHLSEEDGRTHSRIDELTHKQLEDEVKEMSSL